jgi:hypothetical protein
MTSTLDPFTLDGCDDPAGLLACARAQKRVEDDAAREVFKAAAAWAAMHSIASVVGPVVEWHESCLPLGGEGCPDVAEFGTYPWRSPLGYQFLTDHTGTLDVTPDPERRRLAHQFRHHFGDTGNDP